MTTLCYTRGMGEHTSIPMTMTSDDIRNRIYTIRGVQVMLDSDLATIYGYSTTAFNQQVKNNLTRFEGDDFMFQLSHDEYLNLIS